MKRGTKKMWAVIAAATTAVTGVGIASLALTAGAEEAAAPASSGQVTRLIIGYKAGSAQAGSDTAAAESVRAKPGEGRSLRMDRRLATGAVLVDLGGAADARLQAAILKAFKNDPNVEFAEPELWATAQAAPNDPDYSKQWHYFESKAGINLPGAWDAGVTGSGVTVAVIDTGYAKHSDLDANVVAGYDFISNSTAARDGNGRDANAADEGDWTTAGQCTSTSPATNSSWHGTHVAGTIAESTNNGKGGAGVAYGAKIQPVRVLGACGGSFADIDDAIVWASGGTVSGVPANPTPAKVINMSLGGQATCPSNTQRAIDGAVSRGTIVVVAAGNSNQNASGFTPAGCKNVVSVAALDRDGNRAQFRADNSAGSNYGSVVDVAAPGGETWTASDRSNGIYSTLNSGTTTPSGESYQFYQGTSMAAPHVAGVAALALSKKSDLTPAQLETALKDTSRPIPGTCTEGCGRGLVDASKLIASLGGSTQGPTVTNPGDQSTAVGGSANLQIKATDPAGKTLSYSATGLPAGLSIDKASGLITGSPTTAGSNNVTVTATNTDGKSGTATFAWTITDGSSQAPTVTSPGDQTTAVGGTVDLQIRATDPAGKTLTYSATGLPAGLAIDRATGRITGKPTTEGVSKTTVVATNTDGKQGTASFGWTVKASSGGTVTVTKPADQFGFRGWAISPLQVRASSTAGGTLTFKATGLPPGLTISASGVITGTPTTTGTYSVTVTATDAGGSTGSATFGWRVF